MLVRAKKAKMASKMATVSKYKGVLNDLLYWLTSI